MHSQSELAVQSSFALPAATACIFQPHSHNGLRIRLRFAAHIAVAELQELQKLCPHLPTGTNDCVLFESINRALSGVFVYEKFEAFAA